ncbi:MAG: T9SS type A sorting domain-containing protein [Bacteroidales bacterium]|nr:T9SS type A sorting domain-containing protein [Bacteroidales bacterium]
MKKIKLTLLILFFIQQIFGQDATATIETVSNCGDEEILVSIDVTNFINIAAITLFIGYDTSKLTYINHENANIELPGLNSNAMINPTTQVGITWSSINPANIVNAKLLDLKFYYHADNCNLSFNEGCELVNSNLEIILFQKNDGAVLYGPFPSIINHPASITVNTGDDASFSITANNTIGYQWKVSDDEGYTWISLSENSTYTGVNTPLLHINNVSLLMDQYRYLCEVTNGICSVYSEDAVLNVNSFSDILNLTQPTCYLKQNTPNPFIGTAQIQYEVPGAGLVNISVIDYSGRKIVDLVNEYKIEGSYSVKFNADKVIPGIYLYRLDFFGKEMNFSEIKKMIISKSAFTDL